jgi:hypothetical protein
LDFGLLSLNAGLSKEDSIRRVLLMDADTFRRNMETGIYWITRCIAQGAYPEVKLAPELRKSGVTDIFNVGTAPSVISKAEHGFEQVADLPIEDLKRMPDPYVLDCLDRMYAALKQPKRKAYIHCVAGQNRSPSVLYLFLVACGVESREAKRVIEDRTLDAVAGHPMLIDDELIGTVIAHGKVHYLPLARPEITEPL